ncbi:response regulator transcription factor [Sphingobacterium psychroaquaticum]|uniref:response regulator transcription factor n=1 Tax=Sphingobacterium psychroaquaticum TaxID=561061 RepID=UPI00106995A3|nr:LuxR C-terminal-related transcriptional regulator [Sphingobacterium psychroaquaticum]QBQ41185.1 response regulator transcription factor [Sphingobacterium psychroaquaticum]
MKKIIAGLIDDGAEFFKNEGKLYCVHARQTHEWPNFPDKVVSLIEADMLKHPEALRALSEWENLLPEDHMYRYIVCRFGGIDDEPDINLEGKIAHKEYFECGLRGKCRFEGKLCCSIKAEYGMLTKMELEVLKCSSLGYKEIGERLFISVETVSTHMQNLRLKTGLKNSTQLAIYAMQKGVIYEGN